MSMTVADVDQATTDRLLAAAAPWWTVPANLLLTLDWLEEAYGGVNDQTVVRHLLDKAHQYDGEYLCAAAVRRHRMSTMCVAGGHNPPHTVTVDLDDTLDCSEGEAAKCVDCDWSHAPDGARRTTVRGFR